MMKVQDIFPFVNAQKTDEKSLEEVLKRFNWKYEFSEDLSEIQRNTEKLTLLENRVYAAWKLNPEATLNLWNKYCPWAQKSSTPIFLLKLEVQDKK